MSTVLKESPNQRCKIPGTSTGAVIKYQNPPAWSSYRTSITTSGMLSSQELLSTRQMSTSSIPFVLLSPSETFVEEESRPKESQKQIVSSNRTSEATRKSLNELRRLSGLTWDQLAKIFNVSRRSLHFWASGKPLTHSNEEQLNRVLGAIQYINRGSADFNRSLLLKPDHNGNLLFDLLVLEKYEEFKQIAGKGHGRRNSQLGPLSKEAEAARMPQKPEDLVNALQDSVHYEIGQSRPVIRSKESKKQ